MKRSLEASYTLPNEIPVDAHDTLSERPQEYYDRAFAEIKERSKGEFTLSTNETPVYTPEIDVEKDVVLDKLTEDANDATISAEQFDETLRAATPESHSNPQLSFPETSHEGTPTDQEVNDRCNYRLTKLGFILDGIRPYLGEENVDDWLRFKSEIAQTKAISGFHDKIYKIIDLENDVHKFKDGFNVTEADFVAAMNL